MSANLQILFDSIDQGLLILSPDGVVRFSNVAATSLFNLTLGKPLGIEGVQVQLAALGRGYVKLPLEFEIEAPGKTCQGDRLKLKVLESPVGGGYLLVARNVSEATRFDTIITNLANLMSVELAQPMRRFSENLGALLVATVPDLDARYALSEEVRKVLGQGEEIASRVIQLASFAEIFAKSPVVAAERIQVLDLVSALIRRLRPLLDERNIKFNMNGLNQELPVIYGSRDWLVEALYGYIEYMLKHCRVRSDLELVARPYGNFLSLQIRNHGRGLPLQAASRSHLPFSQQAKGASGGQPLQSLGLGMALCKQIVELHHGSLKLSEEDDEITAFVLELPAGAPGDAVVPNLDAEQARRYAQDLMRMMQRQRANTDSN